MVKGSFGTVPLRQNSDSHSGYPYHSGMTMSTRRNPSRQAGSAARDNIIIWPWRTR